MFNNANDLHDAINRMNARESRITIARMIMCATNDVETRMNAIVDNMYCDDDDDYTNFSIDAIVFLNSFVNIDSTHDERINVLHEIVRDNFECNDYTFLFDNNEYDSFVDVMCDMMCENDYFMNRNDA